MKNNQGFIVVFGAFSFWFMAMILIFVDLSSRPWLGGEFRADIAGRAIVLQDITPGGPIAQASMPLGARIVRVENSEGQGLDLTGYEAVLGRHQLHSYQMLDATVEAKTQIWPFLTSDLVVMIDEQGRSYDLRPLSGHPITETFVKPATTLTKSVSLLQGLIVLVIAVGVWIFAPPSFAVRLLALAGIGLTTNMTIGVMISSSELTIPPYYFRPLINIAALGGAVFSYGLLALICHFPSPISRLPVSFLVLTTGLAFQMTIAFQIFELPVHSFQMANLLPVPFAVVASAIQWHRTRNNPVERASVMWFLLSIHGGSAAVIGLYSVPVALHKAPLMSPSIANLSLALIFIGIALGTLRYRLFDIHRIWWKAIAWLIGGFVVVIVDLAIVWKFDFKQAQALPLALLFAGWVYFPMRNRVLGFFYGQSTLQVSEHIPELIGRFNNLLDEEELNGRYVLFLKDAFRASEIGSVDQLAVPGARIENHGLALRVPTIVKDRSAVILGKDNGRQLFSTEDCASADAFFQITSALHDANLRERQKLDTERDRILRDLHDDVGGQILDLIYQAEDEQKADLARGVLATLKETIIVVEDSQSVDFSVAWARFCQEMDARMNGDVSISNGRVNPRILSAREYINLKRILQEVASNALKYARPGSFEVAMSMGENREISLCFANEVSAAPTEIPAGGRGMANINTRISELGGRMKAGFDQTDPHRFHLELVIPGEE